MKVFKFVIISLIILFFSHALFSQSIIGQIVSSDSGEGISGVQVRLVELDAISITNHEGVFKFYDLETGEYTLVSDTHTQIKQRINYKGHSLNLASISIELPDSAIADEDKKLEDDGNSNFSVISLSDNELDLDEGVYQASGILTASRDPFLSTAAFAWGAARFNPRGLTSEFTSTTINGVRMNELNNGRVIYGQWGGLNDMFRNVHTSYGLSASEYGIGFMGGSVDFDIRAGSQREQTRLSYANSNRAYNHRVMLTHSTGFDKNGWAFSISGSRRWAKEGYVPGSFYDVWSIFAGVEKKFSDNHSVFLNLISSRGYRGRTGAGLTEIMDIVDDKYYNPYWGYQNGEKRNSRVGYNNQPIVILGNDLKLGDKTKLHNVISYQFGLSSSTALQWLDAANPAADYHRKLPSRIDNEDVRADVINTISNQPEFFQVDWDFMYEANRDNNRTVDNANGSGQSITGNFARYIVEDRRNDTKELNFNSRLNHQISDNNNLDLGVIVSSYGARNYAQVDDLLGAEYYLDIDRYADPIDQPGSDQKDLNNPNAVKQVGDVYGWDYDDKVQFGAIWLQDQISLASVDLFGGAEFNYTRMWRNGNMRNGYFPEDSYGESEKRGFSNYKLKAGATYKLGRNSLYAKAYFGNRAPYLRNAFISSRINNFYVPMLESVDEKSLELGYGFKSPGLDLRAKAYYVDIENDSELFFFYSEEDFVVDGETRSGAFGSFINHGVDKRHVGVELLGNFKINSSFELKAVASLGQHLYDSRWRQWAFSDNLGYFRNDETIYSNEFFVETSPQKAFNLELKYNSTNYWFATLNLSMFGNRYLDFSTDRRTAQAVADVEEGSEEFNDVIFQEKIEDAITLDAFIYKSFKLKNDHFVYVTVSVSNILNEDFFSGGYEQLRYNSEEGPDYFDTKYYRAYGTNYYIGLTYKF